jgi:hypothetical protein
MLHISVFNSRPNRFVYYHTECNSAHETSAWHNFSSFMTVSESLWHLSQPGNYFPIMRKWDNQTAFIFYMSISSSEIMQAIFPNTGYPYVSVTKWGGNWFIMFRNIVEVPFPKVYILIWTQDLCSMLKIHCNSTNHNDKTALYTNSKYMHFLYGFN